ncbi:patatin-like phospholipase family protein [Salegentibacter mishustinae]|uniref:patatin-like phospholipase family protein n=1 Tax=Salegentibacter mishustinae TaxID=270918 RepID=UPI002491A377|nr:patatin-like phospholipase family protein [Salegentibacter mishustinae]
MEKLKILSIDGGGTRGVIPATILNLIFEDTNKHPRELFDLLAGTSTGGILCTGYSFGISTKEMLNLYLEKSSEIFYDSGWDDLRDGFGKNLGADYSNKRFKKILEKIFGTKKLSDIREQNSNGKARLMVCSFDLNPVEKGSNSDEKPKPINFRPKVFHSDFLRDQEVSLVDLCLMTSAGPTYFPIYKDHVDGGVSLNNPSMAALAYAINKRNDGMKEYRHPDGKAKGLGKEIKDVQILSLGCGSSNKNYIPASTIKRKKNGDWGNLQWVKYLPDMLTETNIQASDYYVNQLLGPEQFKRIQLYFDNPDAPKLIRGKSLGLDVKRKDLLEAMVEYAHNIYTKEKSNIFKIIGL